MRTRLGGPALRLLSLLEELPNETGHAPVVRVGDPLCLVVELLTEHDTERRLGSAFLHEEYANTEFDIVCRIILALAPASCDCTGVGRAEKPDGIITVCLFD